MNKVIVIGRLTRDPEVRYTQGQNPTAVARFVLAVDRRFHRDGEQSADFPSCITFGKTAEFFEKWTKKGTKVAVTGRLQTGSYTNRAGQTVFTTDVVVEEAEFAESKGGQQTAQESAPAYNNSTPAPDADGFMDVPDGIDEELPFN